MIYRGTPQKKHEECSKSIYLFRLTPNGTYTSDYAASAYAYIYESLCIKKRPRFDLNLVLNVK